MKTFNPVKPNAKKSFNVNNQKELFPNQAVLTISPVVEKKHKMLTLSKTALQTLGVKEETEETKGTNRLGIAKGYLDDKGTVGYFIFLTSEEKVDFVSAKGNAVKIKTPAIQLTTSNAMSAVYHGFLNEYHSSDINIEKHFLLKEKYDHEGTSLWLLEELTVGNTQDESKATPESGELSANSDEVFTNEGETVEVSIED